MSKIKEEEDRFYLTDYIAQNGYQHKIDGVWFIVIPPQYRVYKQGNEIKQELDRAGKCLMNDEPTGGGYFKNLTFQQKHELAWARVIKLNDEQAAQYRKELQEYYKNIQKEKVTDDKVWGF